MALTPAAEFVIDEQLVRSLLRAQAPELAGLEIRLAASGWDNEMWRVGVDHVVRLPRRSAAVELIVHEQRWLPELASQLPVPVPVPLVAGSPSRAHPRPWSLLRWLPGTPLAQRPGSLGLGVALAGFLHSPLRRRSRLAPW